MSRLEKKYLGVGSPILDLLAQIDYDFLDGIAGEKGGMELVSQEQLAAILEKIPGKVVRACGGSAGNTSFAIARLGGNAGFLGQLGNDEDGEYYAKAFLASGGDESRFKFIDSVHTARCLSLVTPDSERTMRTDLGAAALLDPESIAVKDFEGIDFVHIEGYLLFNPVLARKVLETAKKAGCEVSLDLGSFEVVAAAGTELSELLENYVDYVFANEDEAKAFTGSNDPKVVLEKLGALCKVAVAKLGADGAWLCENGAAAVFVPAFKAEKVIDTTGAGDYWAAGFIWGVLNGRSLEDAAKIGALLGCEVVQRLGADLPEDVWSRIIDTLG